MMILLKESPLSLKTVEVQIKVDFKFFKMSIKVTWYTAQDPPIIMF